jgi:hypothetical protein
MANPQGMSDRAYIACLREQTIADGIALHKMNDEYTVKLAERDLEIGRLKKELEVVR